MNVGINLAANDFVISYSSARAPWGDQGTVQSGELPLYGDLGSLWASSLHRKLVIGSAGTNVQAFRGDGRVTTFAGGGGGWAATQDGKDVLTVVNGNFVYKDLGAQAVEVYDNANVIVNLGQLRQIVKAYGMQLNATSSTDDTARSIAPAPGSIIQLSDPFGRSIGFTYKVISTSAGSRVVVNQITDPTGRLIVPSYDAEATLTGLTWQDGSTKSFIYDSANANQTWALTGVVDESNKRYATFAFNPDGWAQSTQHNSGPNGAVYSFAANYGSAPKPVIRDSVDLTNNVVWRCHEWAAGSGATVQQPNGSSLGMNFRTTLGSGTGVGQCSLLRFAGYSQTGGSGCSASTSFTDYDSYGNTKFDDDFNGNRTCYAHTTSSDGVANLEKVRVEGLIGSTGANAGATPTTCDSVITDGADLATLFPTRTDVRKISTKWHPNWALKTQQAEPLKLTTWVYNGQLDPTNGGATVTCVTPMYGATSVPTLPDGSPIAVLCKKVEQATTDKNGSAGFNATLDTSDPSVVSQRQWSYSYNQYGQVLTSTDPAGQTTTYDYYTETSFSGTAPNEQGHTMGDLKSITLAIPQHVTTYDLYDRAGHVLSTTDPNGLVTTYTYAPRGWLKTVTQGGMLTQYEYWPTGLLKKTTQPDNTVLYYTYDDAHRLTDVSDQVDGNGGPTGNRVHYVLDSMGNRLSEEVRDSSGTLTRNVARSYDALNRLQTVKGAMQ